MIITTESDIDYQDIFSNSDPLVIESMVGTLVSAGFIPHINWKNNLALLSNNQNKLEEILSALDTLHEAGLLTQTIFTAVVKHATGYQSADWVPKQLERFGFPIYDFFFSV